MSGIFGIFSNNKDIVEKGLCGLKAWNGAYGTVYEILSGCNDFCKMDRFCFSMGGFKDYLCKNSYAGKCTTEEGAFASVCDALVFDNVSEVSDETYLLDKIISSGFESLSGVNGDFAGGFLDKKSFKLTLYRDHMGVRPLFFYSKDNLLVFSTDIRGILAIDEVDKHINENWLFRILTGAVSDTIDETEYQYIYCVQPGGYIEFDFSGENISATTVTYWKPGVRKVRRKNEQEYISELNRLITDAVRIRVDKIAGKIGAELSGGLDSGVIDILINRMGRDCTFFSWTPGEDELPIVEGDERLIIKDICKQEGIECSFGKQKFMFDRNSMLAAKTPVSQDEIDWSLPIILRYGIPYYADTLDVCETAQFMEGKGVSAVFTGHGGDEGVSHRCNAYELFRNHEYYHYFKYMWDRTNGQKNRLLATARRCKANYNYVTEILLKPFVYHFKQDSVLSDDFIEQKRQLESRVLTFAYDPKEYIVRGGTRPRLDVVALYGAFNSVRYLVPYVDYRLIDYALGIPRHLFLNGKVNRYIFRQAFKDILPKSLYVLTNKQEPSFMGNKKDAPAESKQVERISKEVRQRAVDNLKSGYWDNYLNFEFLDKWAQSDEQMAISDEEVLWCITTCRIVENTVVVAGKYVK